MARLSHSRLCQSDVAHRLSQSGGSMSAAKQKGTLAETAMVKYLQVNGFPGAERRALAGELDKGDITGTPSLTFEIKNCKSYSIPSWLKEAAIEKVNANADFCPVISKPHGVGVDSVGKWWFILTVEDGVKLLRDAGYGDQR
jgi:hypothetical protein